MSGATNALTTERKPLLPFGVAVLFLLNFTCAWTVLKLPFGTLSSAIGTAPRTCGHAINFDAVATAPSRISSRTREGHNIVADSTLGHLSGESTVLCGPHLLDSANALLHLHHWANHYRTFLVRLVVRARMGKSKKQKGKQMEKGET